MQELVRRYTAEYMDKVFYFCLKKTGNRAEAEDLASDISLAVLTQFERGVQPVQFSAWVWRIARNRYSMWADARHRRAMCETAMPEELVDPQTPEESALHREELQRLRRELAFISAEYRDILTAYYLGNRRIAEIATACGLPEGTVKSKLFRSRERLKEGMNMAREFGVRSYRPEEVTFISSGQKTSGLPFSAIDRRIANNILLQASDNPSTVEELAMELGIAVPYMEDEVERLVKATLLKPCGERYVTNFVILSRDCQQTLYEIKRRRSAERSACLDTLLRESLPRLRELGIARGRLTDEEWLWLLLQCTVDWLVFKGHDVLTRENGEHWGLMGYEQYDCPENLRTDHSGNGEMGLTELWRYRAADYNGWDAYARPSKFATLLLGECARQERTLDTLSATELPLWRELDGWLAHVDARGVLVPDVAVYTPGTREAQCAVLQAHPLFCEVKNLFDEVRAEVQAVFRAQVSEMFAAEMEYDTNMWCCDLRVMTIHDEVNAGRLSVPASSRSPAGVAVILGE